MRRRKYNLKFVLVAVVTAPVIIALLILAVSTWSVSSPAVPEQKMKQLQIGMRTQQVKKLLGDPMTVKMKSDGTSTWLYGSPLKWYSLSVSFSPDGKVVDFVHDD